MNYLSIITLSVLSLAGCKHAEVTTDYMAANPGVSQEEKGRQLLEASVRAMGYDQLRTIETYQADAVFDWRFPWGAMPMNPLPGAKNKKVRFRFLPNSFDGQVEYLEGRKQGDTYGLQSWTYYQQQDGQYEESRSPRREWALATYHYLLEGPLRLLNADIIRYAGQDEYNGTTYDLVFATWESAEAHKEHDQWLLYLHPETKVVDLANVTIREYFLPFPRSLAEGTVLYQREEHQSGIHFPTKMTIQLMTPKPEKKHVYTLQMSNYQVDTFGEQALRPLPGLKEYGDAKPSTER